MTHFGIVSTRDLGTGSMSYYGTTCRTGNLSRAVSEPQIVLVNEVSNNDGNNGKGMTSPRKM